MITWRITSICIALALLITPSVAGALDPSLSRYSSPNSGYELVTVSDKLPVGNGAAGSFKLPVAFDQVSAGSITLTVLPADLELYYPLNTAADATVYDQTINASRGKLNGTAQLTAGKVGQALLLDGQKDFIESGQPASLNNLKRITWSAWIYPTDVNNVSQQDQMVLSKEGFNYLRLFGRKVFGSFNIGGVEKSVSGTTALENNNWYHIAATYDGAKVRLFLNGNPEAELPSVTGDLNFTAGNFQLGRWQSSDPRYFPGRLDEVKVYGRALSSEEIKREYQLNNEGISSAQPVFTVAAGPSQTSSLKLTVASDASAYDLQLQQNRHLSLRDGAAAVPAINSTITNPQPWSEDTTVGLGFSLGSGQLYAAVPAQPTFFYGYGAEQPLVQRSVVLNYRLDVSNNQPSGGYVNQLLYTATVRP